jgi:hypothetical protein
MTAVPTLAEMRHALSETPPVEEATGVPTLAEMMHANALYQTDPDAYLEHYGVKGMQWGVRRSAALLGRLAGRAKTAAIGTKDEEGNVVGGIRAASRAGAQKLKDMKEGTTLVLTDAEGASKIMSKQSDGTFKEVYLSADAERVLRTTKKAPSELSDAEITAAINRSKKIAEYNALFHPVNPNADLAARAAALDLQLKIRAAEQVLNPPKQKMVKKFINTVTGGYNGYQQVNKDTNGALNKHMKSLIDQLSSANVGTSKNGFAGAAATAATAAAAARSANKQAHKDAEERFWSGGTTMRDGTGSYRVPPQQQKRVNDFVYDITSMGKDDVNNPFYNPTTPIAPAPIYPELERRS